MTSMKDELKKNNTITIVSEFNDLGANLKMNDSFETSNSLISDGSSFKSSVKDKDPDGSSQPVLKSQEWGKTPAQVSISAYKKGSARSLKSEKSDDIGLKNQGTRVDHGPRGSSSRERETSPLPKEISREKRRDSISGLATIRNLIESDPNTTNLTPSSS